MRRLFLLTIMTLVAFSCSTGELPVYEVQGVSEGDIPRIHTIGNGSVITFDGKSQHVTIPIRGRHIEGSHWSVSVVGTAPLREGKFNAKKGKFAKGADYAFDAKSFDYGELVINSEYFGGARAKDQDRLDVSFGLTTPPETEKFIGDLRGVLAAEVSVSSLALNRSNVPSIPRSLLKSEHSAEIQAGIMKARTADENGLKTEIARTLDLAIVAQANERKLLAPVIRKRFSLRTAKSFRETDLEQRVSFTDFKAMPLSSETVRELFGDATDRAFYAVALRIQNTQKINKFVTAGLISAQGSVAIFPLDEDSEPTYTLPIKVTPRRSSLVYKYVDDDSVNRPRAWVFRSLVFAGALTTGLGSVFNYSKNLTQAVSLFTGIAIPEGQKLWPDKARRNLANIVTFSMPDLIKIPAGSSAGGIVFFSKRELHSLVSDSTHFSIRKAAKGSSSLEQPKQLLAQLQMESLDIIFEKTSNKDEVAALRLFYGQMNSRATSQRNGAVDDANVAKDFFASALKTASESAVSAKRKILVVKTVQDIKADPARNVSAILLNLTDGTTLPLDKKFLALENAEKDLKLVWGEVKSDFDKIQVRLDSARKSADDILEKLRTTVDLTMRNALISEYARPVRDIKDAQGDWAKLKSKGDVSITPTVGMTPIKTSFVDAVAEVTKATSDFASELKIAVTKLRVKGAKEKDLKTLE